MQLLVKPSEFDAVAVSGGIDSMVLLSYAVNAKPDIQIVHFHHGTDFGEKAYQFVSEYALAHNLKMHTGFADIKEGSNLEFRWREARYNYFNSLNLKIATAHNANDAAETILLNIIRSNGLNANSIPVWNNNICRPLLRNTRAEIERNARCFGVKYLDDPANNDEHYSRIIVRQRIMPEILRINPGFVKSIGRNLGIRKEEQ